MNVWSCINPQGFFKILRDYHNLRIWTIKLWNSNAKLSTSNTEVGNVAINIVIRCHEDGTIKGPIFWWRHIYIYIYIVIHLQAKSLSLHGKLMHCPFHVIYNLKPRADVGEGYSLHWIFFFFFILKILWFFYFVFIKY